MHFNPGHLSVNSVVPILQCASWFPSVRRRLFVCPSRFGSECHQRIRLWTPLTKDPHRRQAVEGPHPQEVLPTQTSAPVAGRARMLLLALSCRHHPYPHPRPGRSMFAKRSLMSWHLATACIHIPGNRCNGKEECLCCAFSLVDSSSTVINCQSSWSHCFPFTRGLTCEWKSASELRLAMSGSKWAGILGLMAGKEWSRSADKISWWRRLLIKCVDLLMRSQWRSVCVRWKSVLKMVQFQHCY